jgi:anion-transporting  ArsA/GET3 family ATPase
VRLRDLHRLRLLLVTGKGGVGKTTIAAAFARAAAAAGRRTLCVEIVDDHEGEAPLASAFGRTTHGAHTDSPIAVDENLHLAALSASSGHKAFLRDTLPMRMLADAAMKSQAVRRFLHAAPTFAELGVLYRLLDLTRLRAGGEFAFDHIVVDLPATGHALALLQVPAAVQRVVSGGSIGQAVRSGLDLLCDKHQTAALVVTVPEALPVSESLELATGLEASGVLVPGLVLNRVPSDGFTDGELEIALGVASRRPTLGGRTVQRIARARHARLRIKDARPLLFEFLDHDGDALAEMGRALDAAEADA